MKSIKVSDEVHQKLQDLQRPRESLSDVIRRLLETHGRVQILVGSVSSGGNNGNKF